ncbi:high affinity glucose transporter [Sporothrix eucalyptigena]|uniref:High affinity glucose transporter n=1 Tax=Sporothrix eucalyptigena TaxID=1812306 RepID=A0ABP0CEA7_9PEZI
MADHKGITFVEYLNFLVPILVTGFAYGWENGSLGGILAMPQFLDYFHTPDAFRQGIMTASLQAGEFGGSLILGYLLSDRLGRRLTILISIAIYLIGQAIVVGSVSQGMLIAARVINGFGAGALFQTMSLYTAEISPAKIRGRMTAVLNTGIALGLMVAYWVQYGTANIQGAASWRLPLALQLIPAAWVGIHVFLRPETPRWLCSHGRPEEALAVLARLHAGGDTENPFVRAELSEIQVAIDFEKQLQDKTPSYFQLAFSKRYRRRTALAVGGQFLQQLSGPNIVLYYASKVFAQTGTSGTEATLLANGIGSALLLVATLSLNIMIDFYGRRKPLIAGPFLMGVCLVVVGSMLVGFGSPHFDETTQALTFSFANASAGHAAVAFMFLYMVFFGGLYSSVPWTYPNEVLSLEARARGTAMSTAINWFTNFWLGLYIPTALNKAGWKLYFIFAGFCFGISIVSYLFFPETAGRTLEEMELLFLSSRSAFVFRDRDATSKRKLIAHDVEGDGEAAAHDLSKVLAVECEEIARGQS